LTFRINIVVWCNGRTVINTFNMEAAFPPLVETRGSHAEFFMDVVMPKDDKALLDEMIDAKMADAMTPGFEAEFTPEEADRAGAFFEDALSEEDAKESAIDLIEAQK